MNRNKRSITLDLKSDEGRQVAEEIIGEADALVENFRPGVMEKFGLGYEDVRDVNENIVYVSASGFGADGPYAERPGQDILAQAMSDSSRTRAGSRTHRRPPARSSATPTPRTPSRSTPSSRCSSER